MNFSLTGAAPVTISIEGTEYRLPRFLMPQFEAWVEARKVAQIRQATEHLDDDQKARFLMYYQPEPVDIMQIAQELRSPAGARHVIAESMKSAGVPKDVIDKIIQFGDPLQLYKLADKLSSVDQAVATMAHQSGAVPEGGGKASPLSEATPTSGDSPATGS